MDYSQPLPFARGTTHFGSISGNTPDANVGNNLLGQIFVVRDTVHGTGKPIYLQAVRNTSGGPLYAKKSVIYDTSALPETAVNAYSYLGTGPIAGVVDDQYGSKAIPNNDIFWIVVNGPCDVTNSFTTMGANVAIGDYVSSVTAAGTTAATTAIGRFTSFAAAATTNSAAAIKNTMGIALEAATTGQTNADFLVDVKSPFSL